MKFRWMKLAKVALMLTVAAVLGGVVMLLWNAVMPALFVGVLRVDYWHALGLLILCRILFGGFRGRGGPRGHERWQRWQRWQAMTPEERAQFREQYRHHRFGRCWPGEQQEQP